MRQTTFKCKDAQSSEFHRFPGCLERGSHGSHSEGCPRGVTNTESQGRVCPVGTGWRAKTLGPNRNKAEGTTDACRLPSALSRPGTNEVRRNRRQREHTIPLGRGALWLGRPETRE